MPPLHTPPLHTHPPLPYLLILVGILQSIKELLFIHHTVRTLLQYRRGWSPCKLILEGATTATPSVDTDIVHTDIIAISKQRINESSESCHLGTDTKSFVSPYHSVTRPPSPVFDRGWLATRLPGATNCTYAQLILRCQQERTACAFGRQHVC